MCIICMHVLFYKKWNQKWNLVRVLPFFLASLDNPKVNLPLLMNNYFFNFLFII